VTAQPTERKLITPENEGPLNAHDQAILDKFDPATTTPDEAKALFQATNDRFHSRLHPLFQRWYQGGEWAPNDDPTNPEPTPTREFGGASRGGDDATERQLKYIASLRRQRDHSVLRPELQDSLEVARLHLKRIDDIANGASFDDREAMQRPLYKSEASELIDALNECPPAQRQEQPKVQADPNGIDLTPLPAGHYAVPGGDTRLKVRIDKPAKGKWIGWVFVKDGAEYGEQQRYGKQRPNETYEGRIQDELRAILADPQAAAYRYGQLTGRCAICNRMLEDEASVARGIGPVCIQNIGW
jgi:hypothetical protein